jgi:peptidoglycan DL-endopeptidase LytF
MRTELKIGVTVLLVVSVMVLVYFVFFAGGENKSKQRDDLGSIPAGADANRSPSPRIASRTPSATPSPAPRATPARTAAPEPVATLAPIVMATPRPTDVPTIADPDLRASRTPESGVIPPPVLATPRPAEPNRLAGRPEPTPIYIREPSGVATIPPPVVDDRTTIPPVRTIAEPNSAVAARPGLVRKADGKDYYVVQRDDQGYWGIAAKAAVYGDGRRWDIIAKANPSVDPARLQVGQELVIPPLVRAADTTPRPASLSTTRPAGAHELYTIKSGDNLESIAKAKYGDGTLWKDIAKANPGLDPSRLRIGQEIVVPPAADHRATATTAPSGVGPTTRPSLARHTAPSPVPASATERPRPTPAAAGGWD